MVLVGVAKNDTKESRFWISCTQAVIAARSPTCVDIFLHDLLSLASAVISSSVRCAGKSMKKPPADCRLNCTRTANFTSLSPFSLSRCPSHTNRRFLIARTRSHDLVLALASWCRSFPVKRLRHRALAPLIIACVLVLKSHASQPYVKSEHTAVL